MASPRQWSWANFVRCWGTQRPGVLQCTGLQRFGHDWATEQQQLKQHSRDFQSGESVEGGKIFYITCSGNNQNISNGSWEYCVKWGRGEETCLSFANASSGNTDRFPSWFNQCRLVFSLESVCRVSQLPFLYLALLLLSPLHFWKGNCDKVRHFLVKRIQF